ncbi:hypothetical protein [Wenzhouxiangella sediminis]|uniref:Lipoprotein n=1 Tax=Wenzhouxiangella sediminis TaxID=1792836 RepID=A0A3E1K8C7_9GAMM|nr:hypothetical protein [Wenzhouxiangella sediminis]RFF29937.1 hypothetical protein DZC52_10910 [Wenzhouxiangella sediminis]
MRNYSVAALTACLLLSACATTRYTEGEFPRRNADLDILATQQEIESEAWRPHPLFVGTGAALAGASGGLAMGLVGFGMMDAKKEDATKALAPLRERLDGYDFGSQFAARIQSADITERLVADAEPVVWDPPGPPEDREIERRLITIEPRVQLSSDMRSLLVDIEVWEFFPRDGYTPSRKGFSQTYRFLWPLADGDDLEREEAAAAWLERPREDLVALIETGMAHTVGMLETHLKQGTPALENTDELIRIQPPGNYYLWQDHQEVSWLARKWRRGIFYAVPDHAIEDEPELNHQSAR